MRYSLGVCRNRLATPSLPVLSSPGPRRRDVQGPGPSHMCSGTLERRPAEPEILWQPASPGLHDPARSAAAADSSVNQLDRDTIDRMDTRQVWRAALGELQVSLSPANFETWLRDTTLVDVEDNKFRIAVPNGFAKDWLDTRYRSLISQTLARIVGYSVVVEILTPAAPVAAPVALGPPAGDGTPRPSPAPQAVPLEARRGGGGGGPT